jgi:small-conductance mechanosensitive channel
MTITREEAERLVRLSNFADHLQTLQYKEMRQLITELTAERDALRAENARLREAEAKMAAGCLISNAAEVADLVAQARRDALEEAAQVVINLSISTPSVVAAAIRALKGEGHD